MSGYRRSRAPNGRFRRSTLENTFGLSAKVCTNCRAINLREAGKPMRTWCHACGRSLDAGTQSSKHAESGRDS